MTSDERYIQTHERIKARAIFRIFSSQQKRFVELLNKQDGKTYRIWETKESPNDIVDGFLDSTKSEIPTYLTTVLPKVMNDGAKPQIARYKELLPRGYSLSFDIETSPASKYMRDLEDLYLSERDGSILKTTRDELRKILADGIDAGLSYGQIGKKIMETDPFVFSRSRANLIAVNEVGHAYGFGGHQPAVDLQKEGYIMEKVWTTSRDEKVRLTHTANQTAGFLPLDKPFPGTGDQYAPSQKDIRCRCTSTHKIVGIKTEKGVISMQGHWTVQEIKKIFDNSAKEIK